MSKYFSYEGCEGEFSLHSTLDEAKSAAINEADKSYCYGGEWDGSFSEELQDGIRRTCFGVILGDFSLPTRPLTEAEKEEYGNDFNYMVEHPQLVEYNRNNGWIKCSEELPKVFDHNGFERSDVVMCFGVDEPDDETYVLAYMVQGNRFYGFNGECTKIRYWRPLPIPPQEFMDKS
ncbi:DUF551 domain-containing protein [Rodentibacter myodis]|uniref:DUF551 domain-containing protein n=1 Tax=Rodentibacter myodis TaxID=1907939 RepID=A0A1V3JR85_9PAST|nr:DUF551 domain-containing protein [Rodentibacter myodis]OOF59317.1 hypothetical protein BKL49_04380 [Rodentibacter myodis]